MKKIHRTGTVGLGGIARGVHLPGVDRSPDLQLAAICDIDRDKLIYFKELYGIDDAHCFTDYHDLIACADVDAVDICTPNDVHFEVAKAAILANKPYAVEKPITISSADADELARLTKEKDLKNMVCFSYRFKAAARFVRDLIQSDALGRIFHVDAQYFQSFGSREGGGLRWRYIKEHAGSGALGDLGCHAFDLVRFMLGGEYTKTVSHLDTYVKERPLLDGSGMGKVDVDDFVNCLVSTDTGVACSFQITRFAYGRGNYQRVEIYGKKGGIVYDLDREGTDADEIHICIGDPYGITRQYTKLPIPAKYKADQMQCFADILNGCGDGLAATIFDGQVNQHLVDAILASGEKGRWVTV